MWLCLLFQYYYRKKFRSASEVYRHAATVHCPDNIDTTADIYCQWGSGPNLCDNLPRKRFSLMTHLFDRHCTVESFNTAVQRRMLTGYQPPATAQMQPVTIIKQSASSISANGENTSSSVGQAPLQQSSTAALHAIKKHSVDISAAKEFNVIESIIYIYVFNITITFFSIIN